jgi:hemolysin-activating ACP:hemolysin acyltransferase
VNKPEAGFKTNLVPAAPKTPLAASPNRQKGFAESFAQIVAVLMRDRNFRSLTLADLEAIVLPPLIAGQFGLAHAPQSGLNGRKSANESGREVLVPVAVALWARVSATIDKRLSEDPDKQVMLQSSDWVSGNNIWLMVLGGDPRAVPKFLEELLKKDFRGQGVKMRTRASDGKVVIKTIGPCS